MPWLEEPGVTVRVERYARYVIIRRFMEGKCGEKNDDKKEPRLWVSEIRALHSACCILE